MHSNQLPRECLLSNLCFSGFLAPVRQPQPDGARMVQRVGHDFVTLFLGTRLTRPIRKS